MRAIRIHNLYRFGEMPDRCGAQTRKYPPKLCVVGHLPHVSKYRFPGRRPPPGKQPSITFRIDQVLQRSPTIGREQVTCALAVGWHKGIQIDDTFDTLRNAIGGGGNDGSTRAGAYQRDALETFEDDQVDHVRDVRAERHRRVGEMCSFPEAGQRRGMDVMSGGAQQCRDVPPAPTPEPGRMHEYERSHRSRSVSFGNVAPACDVSAACSWR